MTTPAGESQILGPLFSDPEVAALFADEAYARAMLNVEAALAVVEARLNVIPSAPAWEIVHAAADLEPDLAGLRAGSERAGVPVIALVEQLRAAAGPAAAPYVHWGATSQDIIDSALVLRLRDVLDLLAARLDRLIGELAGLAAAHRATVMAARTRSQQALPTSFGLKVAGWLLPLVRHRERLGEIRPRLLVVQFGGAAGTLAALGDDGLAVMQALAAELDLGAPAAPWHAQRDSLAELAGWLSLVTGSLGKMGQDLILLAQTELGEVRESGDAARGGSSTMPQKSNPVASEALVTIARMNATLLANMHHALIQEQERGSHGWPLEWLTLPQMAVAAGAALKHALFLAGNIEVRARRMAANVAASHGLILAEAASFALAAHLPRPEAQARVKQACRTAAETGRHLIDILREETEAPLDWEALKDPKAQLGAANLLIDRVLARCKSTRD